MKKYIFSFVDCIHIKRRSAYVLYHIDFDIFTTFTTINGNWALEIDIQYRVKWSKILTALSEENILV